MIIPPPAVRTIDRDLAAAKQTATSQRTRRQHWLVAHGGPGHVLTGLDNHDTCRCGAVFWRPAAEAPKGPQS